jgi:excisionase family DNA binding protein
LERETGFEPATLSLGTQIRQSGSIRPATEELVSVGVHSSGNSAATGSKRPVSAPSSGILPAGVRHLRVIDGRWRDLLTVRDVAARLSLSTATVYKLCRRGELLHVRIANTVRVTPEDLRAFVEKAKKRDE